MSAPPAPAPEPEGRPSEPALQTAARLLAEGRPAEAAAFLGALVAGAPAYAAAHVLHATALEADGRPAEALAAWDHAAFLVPRSPLVRRERQRLAAALPAAETIAPQAAGPERVGPETVEPTAAESEPAGATDAEPEAAEARGTAEAAPVEEPDEEPPGLNRLSLDALVPPPAAPAAPPSDAVPPPTERRDSPEPVAIEGLPLESLTTLFETDTPFFGDDDEDDAPESEPFDGAAESDTESGFNEPFGGAASAFFTGRPAPEAVPEDLPPLPTAPPDAVATADWGDLPPLEAPVLSPEGPAHAPPPPPPAEPEDWRVVDAFGAPLAGAPDEAALPFEDPSTVRPFAPEPAAEPERPEPERPEPAAFEAPPPPDDLDALISQLEQAPRIRPDPAFAGPEVRPDESEVDEMVSETLAQIYAAQHRYVEAAVTYERLAARDPRDADRLLRRAAELRGRG